MPRLTTVPASMKNANVFSTLSMSLAFLYSIWMFGTCQQSEIYTILAYSLTAFIVYATFLLQKPKLLIIFLVGVVARMILLPSFPGLSDDIYRFVWDGRLTSNGFNPYSYLPSEILTMNISGLGKDLYSELNSPNYFTIYPPISQCVFWISTWFGDDLMTSNLVMKTIFIIAEVFTFAGIIKILDHLNRPRYFATLYWLNPLIIIEGTGNLHFEILMIAFLVWAIYFLFVKQFMNWAALFFSLSIAAKLLPLMLLPYMLFRLENRNRKVFFTYLIGISLLLFTPIFFGFQLLNFGESIDLYFQKFEYNASLYYVMRYLGKLASGYNLIHYIGPLLGLLALGVIIRLARRNSTLDTTSFINFSLMSFTTYLLCATTVHPWYLCMPILFAVFTRSVYVVVWSVLAMWTYVNYSYPIFHENMWVVAFEYCTVVLLFLYELAKTKTFKV